MKKEFKLTKLAPEFAVMLKKESREKGYNSPREYTKTIAHTINGELFESVESKCLGRGRKPRRGWHFEL